MTSKGRNTYGSRRNSHPENTISERQLAPSKPTVDPFISHTNQLLLYDLFKLFVPGLILLPVRLLLVMVVLALANLWTYIMTIGIKVDIEHPELIPTWRLRITRPLLAFGARLIMFIVGFYNIRVKGTPASSKVRICLLPF